MDYLGLTGDPLEIVKGHEALLQKRVLKNPDDARLQALLMWGIQNGSIEQLRTVLAAGADPNFRYNRSETPLGLVIHWRREAEGAAEFFRELVRAGADPSGLSENKTLMSIACAHGNTQWAIDVLLETTPRNKWVPADLNAALLVVAYDATRMKKLLAAGASVNHLGTIDNAFIPSTTVSALMLASFFAAADVVDLLLASGADVNLQGGQGRTALDYAGFDSKRCHKIMERLQAAGAISARPFPRPGQTARGFAAAARKPEFKEAVVKIRQLTGIKPATLQNQEGRIPGGQGFLLDRDPGKNPTDDRLARFAAQGEPAKQFVERYQSELLAQEAYLFHSRDLVAKNGNVIALLPTTDVYRVIAAVETEGPNVSTEDLVAWLRTLKKVQPFSITGIGADFIEGKFTTPILDAPALVKRINKLCPDGDEGPAAEARQIETLLQTRKLFLWWD